MNITSWLHSSYYGIPLDRTIGSLIILFGAITVVHYALRFFRRFALSRRQRLRLSYETLEFLMRLLRVLLWIGAGFLLLNLWGVGISGLWTSLMSIAAIIGVGFLAVWTMVSNVTANLFLTIWRPFHLGATVEILPENFQGKVVEINMMFTVMRESKGSALYIPNNLFFQKAFRVIGKDSLHPYESFEIDSMNDPVV
jgi:small-conductance mechanosensitive channel